MNGIYYYIFSPSPSPSRLPLAPRFMYYIMQKIIDAKDNAINVMTPCAPTISAMRCVAAEEWDAEADAIDALREAEEAEDVEIVLLAVEFSDATLELVVENEEKDVIVELPETTRTELPDGVVESKLSVTRLAGRDVVSDTLAALVTEEALPSLEIPK